MFWAEKPAVLIVGSGSGRRATASNALWDGEWKCIGHTANTQIE